MEARILRQVEFYFSEESLCMDEFLRGKVDAGDGFVELSLIAGFAKMKAFTEDVQVIVNAIKDSDLVHLNQDKTGVGRRFPLPDKDPDASRVVFISGLNPGADQAAARDATKQFGEASSIRMLRNYAADDRPLNGTALVTFSTDEEASSAIDAAPFNHQVDGETLTIAATGLTAWYQTLLKKRQGMKRKRADDQTNTSNKKQNAVMEDYPRGCIVAVDGWTTGTTVQDIKDACSAYGKVLWVEEPKGDDTKALVRFEDKDKADAATTGIKDKQSATLQATVLEGEEEKQFWAKEA